MKDSEFLSWIWQRMVNVHGEQSNVDYMLRLNGIILSMKDSDAESATSFEQPKPRTKTEFVKVTGSIFDLKDLLENEELYFSTDTDEYDYCNNERDLCAAVYNGNIYRKVETEIDERQEFIGTYASLRHEFHGQRTYDDFSGFMYDSGKFKLVDSND